MERSFTIKKYTCPCCGYKTLEEEPPGTYDICTICFWEDDPVQFNDPFYRGGANHVSLVEGQSNFIEFGACEYDMIRNVRKPTEIDEKDINWKKINYENNRSKEIIIDVSKIESLLELHTILKSKLEFSDYYGMNWDDFWHGITGLFNMPENLILVGWANVEQRFPRDSRVMKNLFEHYNNEYPMYSCQVYYK